jgi:carboxynorspermidine decarboxylase
LYSGENVVPLTILEIHQARLETPAFVYDEDAVLQTLSTLDPLRQGCGLKVLYSIKAFPFSDLMKAIAPLVDGFSVSSLFEARLAHEVLGDKGIIHITTPGFRADEMPEIAMLCRHIAFNSVNQWRRFKTALQGEAQGGLRINPQLSFLEDPRYDPCRKHSKLGAPLSEVQRILSSEPETLSGLAGIHFHTHFGARSFRPLAQTVAHLEERLGPWLSSLAWVNLGGGYLFDDPEALNELLRIVERLRHRYGVEVLFEPGKGVVGQAGYLVSSVIDLFESDGKQVAVLDTTVNHIPEVFEYQIKPTLAEAREEGRFTYLLAGASCLSGDLFGEHCFDEPLQIGSRLTFLDVGAYTLVKASRFNGINLPSVYAYTSRRGLELKKSYEYAHYRDQWTSE